MDKLNRTTGAALRTRDVGVLCGERVPVNDKCIMVGTTGIAALKAEYGDDFTNFEIIQDVGYSSESSTHLSGDDAGLEQHFNVRIYKYSKDGQPTSLDLREGFESSTLPRAFPSLGSSLESSSSAAASLDDSGLGTGEALTNGDSADVADQFRADDEFGQDDLDYLETVLDECVDFGANTSSEPEELHFTLSGLDSDDSSDNFHNRSSFTSSAQVFYKILSVESDNGETENNNNNSEIDNIPQDAVLDKNLNISTVTVTNYNTNSSLTVTDSNKNNSSLTIKNSSISDSITLDNGAILNASVIDDAKKTVKCASSDSDPETFKPVVQENSSSSDWGRGPQVPHRIFCSTPIRNGLVPHRNQSLKRKRDSDAFDATRMSSRVRSWLNRCSDFSIPSRHRIRPALRSSPDLPQTFPAEDISSCDASCEYTSSSSADEGNNVYSSMSSFGEDDVFRQNKSRVDSGSAEGSVETVLHALLDSDCPFLLPPPPSSSASFGSGSKICSTVCCQTSRHGKHLKASSDGELRKRSSRKEVSNLPGSLVVQRLILSKTRADPRLRLYSSLPNVLRHLSDSSTDDYLIPSTLPSHSDSKTTGGFHHSSSSEVGRRRRRRSRKKSTSSNRSSTSALLSSSDRGGRLRSRTGTSSSRCGSRRRNASQRSDFLCPAVLSSDEEKNSPLKVEIPPEAESVGFDELRRASSALLSPVESDVVLTHLEEQSTVSDQVWDGYQEMPYLSEGYSEATVDEDAVRKLTEFGDDYGSAIGLPLRLLDPPDGNNNKTEFSKSPKKLSKSIPVVSSISDDSDSDSEDLNYVIEETDKALHFAKSILRRRQGGESLTSADYAELLATCGTHLRCLQTICKHIDGKEHNFSDNHLQQLRHRIEQWLELKRSTEMFETLDGPARQKYLKARENIDALYRKMSQIASCSNLNTETFYSWDDVEKHLSRLQMVLTSLMGAKEQLLSVNLQVHRFTTEYGSDVNYKDCSLKDDVTELYRQWEDIYEQNGAHLTELEALKSDWEAYEEKFQRLRLKEQEIESRINEDCDNKTTKLSEDESDRLRSDLEEVKRSAASLASRLKGGDAWKKIDEEVENLKQRIGRRETHLRKKRTYPSENRRCSSSLVEDDADDHFEDAIQILCEGKDRSSFSTPQKKDTTPADSPKHKRGRFWRIVRIAVPVQLALVILYCIACCLEPGCCNTLNNFNLSFTPQLRYFGGRPPV